MIVSYLIFQVLLQNLNTCPVREYRYRRIYSMSEVSAAAETRAAAIWLTAGRTIARYMRDIVKTHARVIRT